MKKSNGKMQETKILKICRSLPRKLHKQFIFAVNLLKKHLLFYEQ